ncbi:hypothetical protein J7K93_10285 [bacterium]|nr:hypothetical protein [bacterium]
MAFTYRELKKKTHAELEEIAKDLDHEAVQGYTQLNKDHLLEAVCKALNIDMHEHHEVIGVNKAEVKAHIKKLKALRDKAFKEKDLETAKKARSRIKRLKRTLHKAAI